MNGTQNLHLTDINCESQNTKNDALDKTGILQNSDEFGSSFQYKSGSTLANNNETVYFVLEPASDSQMYSNEARYNPESRDFLSSQLPQTQANNNFPQSRKEKSMSREHQQGALSSRKSPGRTRTGTTKCLEPDCNFVCARIPQLRTHLEEVHGIQQERKMFDFSSEDEFKSWLSMIEREATCTFMRRRGWQFNKNGSVTACFYCHRGGAYTSKATKKQIKAQGSCKIGIECTASMRVTMWSIPRQRSGKRKRNEETAKHVQVEAYLQHYGHNLDINHTRISQSEKDDIARKLSKGISRSKILDDVRSTLDSSAAPHRLHLLTLQDLYNIEKKEGIKTTKRSNSDEGTTVQAWIEKMQKSEDNPVLLIKYQQEKAKEVCSCLSDDDFILILQTPLQAMMLRRYGPHQCICVDITKGYPPGRSDANFYLMSIEVIIPVLNDQEEVFPVAWFVCNRKDRAVIKIFLSEIKKNLSDLALTPSYLLLPSLGITGGCDWFSVWISIFGPGPRKLICGWHMIEELKQRIHRLSAATSSAIEETRLTSNLQAVLNATNVEEFVGLLEQFLNDLSTDKVTLPLADNFKANYTGQPEAWSRAYRPDSHVQTELRFEDYHKKVARNIYQEGFKRKQLDVLIKTLMRHSRDRALNRLRQTFKLTNEPSIRRMTSLNHTNSIQLPIEYVTPQESPRTWSVVSVIDSVRAVEKTDESGLPIKLKKVAVEYIVKCVNVDRCPARLNCAYRCKECGICSHHFSCTCQMEQKYVVAGEGLHVLCEHSHLVVRYLHQNGKKVEALFEASCDAVQPSKQVVVMVMEDDDVASEHDDDDELVNAPYAKASDGMAELEATALGSQKAITISVKPVVPHKAVPVMTTVGVRRSGRTRNLNYCSKA